MSDAAGGDPLHATASSSTLWTGSRCGPPCTAQPTMPRARPAGILSVVRSHPLEPQPYTGMVPITSGEVAGAAASQPSTDCPCPLLLRARPCSMHRTWPGQGPTWLTAPTPPPRPTPPTPRVRVIAHRRGPGHLPGRQRADQLRPGAGRVHQPRLQRQVRWWLLRAGAAPLLL